jgi:hypothetical protein
MTTVKKHTKNFEVDIVREPMGEDCNKVTVVLSAKRGKEKILVFLFWKGWPGPHASDFLSSQAPKYPCHCNLPSLF